MHFLAFMLLAWFVLHWMSKVSAEKADKKVYEKWHRLQQQNCLEAVARELGVNPSVRVVDPGYYPDWAVICYSLAFGVVALIIVLASHP